MLVSVKDETNEITETKMEISCMIAQWACKFWEVITLSFIMLKKTGYRVLHNVVGLHEITKACLY